MQRDKHNCCYSGWKLLNSYLHNIHSFKTSAASRIDYFSDGVRSGTRKYYLGQGGTGQCRVHLPDPTLPSHRAIPGLARAGDVRTAAEESAAGVQLCDGGARAGVTVSVWGA